MPKLRKDFRLAHHKQAPSSVVVPRHIIERMFRQAVEDRRTGCLLYIPTPCNWGPIGYVKNPRRYPALSWTDEHGRLHAIRLNRLALILATDAPAPDLTLDALHACANPRCISSKHLRWGTSRENSEDFWRFERIRRRVKRGKAVRLTVRRLSTPVCGTA